MTMHDIMQGMVVVEERTSSSEMRKKWVCKTDALTCLLIPSLLVSCSLSLSHSYSKRVTPSILICRVRHS